MDVNIKKDDKIMFFNIIYYHMLFRTRVYRHTVLSREKNESCVNSIKLSLCLLLKLFSSKKNEFIGELYSK